MAAPTQAGGAQAESARREYEKAAAALLIDLTKALHGVSLPSDIVEQRIGAVARGLGLDTEVFTLQSFVAAKVSVGKISAGGVQLVDLARVPFNSSWNLKRLRELGMLCGRLVDGTLDVAGGRIQLDRILAAPPLYSKGLVVLSYGVYGAAVAARVRGSTLEVAAAGLIGIIAGIIHYETTRYRFVDLQQSFFAAFCGSLAAFALAAFLPKIDTAQALYGGITMLVPAMVVTIGIHELSSEAVESGLARLAYGVLRFLMIGFGIVAAAKLWSLFGRIPLGGTATPLPTPAIVAMLIVGGLALTVCLQGRRRDVGWIVGAVILAYATQEATKLVFADAGSPFIAAFVLGVAGRLHARIPGNFAGTIVIPGFLQLSPGFIGTNAVVALLRADELGVGPDASQSFLAVFLVALQLVSGLIAAELFRWRR